MSGAWLRQDQAGGRSVLARELRAGSRASTLLQIHRIRRTAPLAVRSQQGARPPGQVAQQPESQHHDQRDRGGGAGQFGWGQIVAQSPPEAPGSPEQGKGCQYDEQRIHRQSPRPVAVDQRVNGTRAPTARALQPGERVEGARRIPDWGPGPKQPNTDQRCCNGYQAHTEQKPVRYDPSPSIEDLDMTLRRATQIITGPHLRLIYAPMNHM